MSLVFALFATLRVFIAISTGHFCALGNLTLSCAIWRFFWQILRKSVLVIVVPKALVDLCISKSFGSNTVEIGD